MARSKTAAALAKAELQDRACQMRVFGKSYYAIAAELNLTINQTMRLLHDAYVKRAAEYDPYPESYRLMDELIAKRRAELRQKPKK